MPDATVISNWDIFFRIWAVVGTLLTTGLTAWWTRKIAIEDREHQYKLELKKFKKDFELKEDEYKKLLSEKLFNEGKSAIVNFSVETNKYCAAYKRYIHNDQTTDNIKAHDKALNDYNKAFFELKFSFIPPDVVYTATTYRDFTLKSLLNQTSEEYDKQYKEWRDNFEEAAKEYLDKCRKGTFADIITSAGKGPQGLAPM